MQIQPGPPCKGYTRLNTRSVRCKLCVRFYDRLARIRQCNNQLHAVYEKLLKDNPMRRRAFIVRSHKAQCDLTCWIKQELHAMWSNHGSLHVGPTYILPELAIRITILGPADMNPVETFTQEHPHRHRLAIPRCITCPLYVKWARHIYNLPTTHRTCGLVAFRTRAVNTSSRQCSRHTVPRPQRLGSKEDDIDTRRCLKEKCPDPYPTPANRCTVEHDRTER